MKVEEYWDIYDENRNKTNRLHKRVVPLSGGDYHIVVEIWTVNINRQILLTKRHPDKPWGNFWECTGGSVVAGEDSITGAKRELLEETGIDALKDNLIQIGSLQSGNNFYDTYLIKKNIAIQDLTLQAEEVIDAKWVTMQEFTKMCSDEIIAPPILSRFNLYQNKILEFFA